MSDAVIVAIIGGAALLANGGLTAALASRANRNTKRVVDQVTTNGGSSLKDAVVRTEATVNEIRAVQTKQGERVAALEGRLEDHARQELARWQLSQRKKR